MSTFHTEDQDKVDTYEFICGLTLISQTTLIEKLEILFRLYDFDENQFITRDELIIMLISIFSALEQ